MFDIARDGKKIQRKTIDIFYFCFFTYENLYFFRKHIWENLAYVVTFALQFFRVAGQLPYRYAPICDRRSKVVCIRLGVLT